mgnify:CR=1 FL=1|tara:strand:+ start:654 stop:887 length:234 start_codon:yes stop_codon:yes gene_type:complete
MKDKTKLLIKTLGSLPGAIIANKAEKMFGRGRIKPNRVQPQNKMHGGKVHDAKYYKDGGKVAGCGPARNNPNMTKKA